MNLPVLDPAEVRRVVDALLEEDLGARGDITAAAVIPENRRARAKLIAREAMVAAGVPFALEVFRRLDPSLATVSAARDGDRVREADVLLAVDGSARALLSGERSALNLLQRMCGIATTARAAVDELEGTGVVVLDTRKTAPGLRRIDKYAVACGGATNHRMGLFDAIMIKDTHVAAAGPLGAAVLRALAHGYSSAEVTAEVATVAELEEALEAGAGRVLLDNMDLETLRECVRRGKGRAVLEASGGLKLGHLREVAATGVDCLSIGALTHSVKAADLAMDLEVLP